MKKKTKTQKAVPFREVSTIAMVAGNEKKFSKIIHDGILKEWVGFGWVDLHKATDADKAKYPSVAA